MIIKSEIYSCDGLIREAVRNGFGDLKLEIEKEEIRTFKYILYMCNDTFRKLLDDPLFEEPLKLCDGCSKESFFMLEKYYQGIEIEINDENCVDLLSICVCYNESRIIPTLIDYVINNLDGNIAVVLLNKKEILKNENLKELKEELEEFIKNESYKIIKSGLFNNLLIDNVEYIFSSGILFNGNEIGLLELLIDYYRCNTDNLRVKNKIKNIMEMCNFSFDNQNSLNKEDKKLMNELAITPDMNKNEKYSIKYFSIPEIKNQFLYDFLVHYYPEEDIQEFSFNKSNLVSLKNEDILYDLDNLLKTDNIKLVMIAINLYHSLNLVFDSTKYLNVFDFFCCYYNSVDDEVKQKLLLKEIVLFILEDDNRKKYNEMIFEKMKEKLGIEFLFILFKNKNLFSQNKYQFLLNYIHSFRLKEEECEKLDSIIEDEKTKKMVRYHKLKSISYSEYYNDLKIGEKVFLLPKIDDIVDVEEVTVQPDLPVGLSLDKSNGIIRGTADEYCDNKYTITAKNACNKVKTEIKLFIKNKIHFNGCTHDEHGQLDTFEKIFTSNTRNDHYGCHFPSSCCLNIKLEKGIYHFIFKLYGKEFRIGAKMVAVKGGDMSFYWNNENRINGWDKYKYGINIKNNEYEIIFDMNKRTFNIKDSDNIIHTLVKDIKENLYPCVYFRYGYCELLKSWIE